MQTQSGAVVWSVGFCTLVVYTGKREKRWLTLHNIHTFFRASVASKYNVVLATGHAIICINPVGLVNIKHTDKKWLITDLSAQFPALIC